MMTKLAASSLVFLGAVALAGCAAQAPATTSASVANVAPEVPQAIRLSHANTLEELTALTRRRGEVGAVARKALPLIKAHFQREQEYIMPPLSLAHSLADGKISPSMRWAVTMADRIKTDREAIFQEHAQITELMNALLAAAQHARDAGAEEFARSAVADSLEDMEIAEPVAIVIGDYVRSRLPPQ